MVGFAGSSLGDSSKGSENSLGTRQEMIKEKIRRLATSMPEVTGLAEMQQYAFLVGSTATAPSVRTNQQHWPKQTLGRTHVGGSRIKRRSHTEAAASSGDRTRRQPRAAKAVQAAASRASGSSRKGRAGGRAGRSRTLAVAQAAAVRWWRR
ncbi:hypothetical protein GW17_00051407 [Ensete ventricosum]|nr:hypothetical protein GW17_00051407 [Ensete ventricosum]